MNYRKIISAALLSIMLIGNAVILKPIEVFAATVVAPAQDRLVGTVTTKLPYKTRAWETYSNAYGDYATTLAYAQNGHEGTLNATKIKLVARASSVTDDWVTGRSEWTNRSATSGYKRYASDASFSSTLSTLVYDSVLNKNVNAVLGQSGGKYGINTQELFDSYVSNGSAANYNMYGKTAYGVMGNNPNEDFIGDAWNTASPNPRHESDDFWGSSVMAANLSTYKSWDDYSYTWADSPTYVNADDLHALSYSPALVYDAARKNSYYKGGWWFKSATTGSLNKLRRGINITYRMYYDAINYGQDYSGWAYFEDYKSGTQSATVWDVYVRYEGSVEDKNENNFSVDSVSSNINPAVILNGGPSSNIKTNITFTVKNKKYPVVGGTYSPIVKIMQGTTELWSSAVNVNSGGATTKTVAVIPSYKEGSNPITVEVNGAESIKEVIPNNSTPYSDNAKTILIDGVIYTSNLVMDNVIVSPVSSIIYDGAASVTQEVAVTYTIINDRNVVGITVPVMTDIVVKNGNTVIGADSISIPPGGTVTKTIVLNANIAVGKNAISVEVNSSKSFFEFQKGVANPYLDNKKSANIDGSAYQSNLFVEQVVVTPNPINIDKGAATKTQTSNINFTIKHDRYPVGDSTQMSPIVVIKNGATILWQGAVPINPGEKTTRSVQASINYKAGNNSITVEVNGNKAIFEQKSGVADPYADNLKTIVIQGLTQIGCALPIQLSSSRTKNTWSENWTTYFQRGNVGVKNGSSFADVTAYTETVVTESYEENYNIQAVYFRSKWTRDMGYDDYRDVGYNDYMEDNLGWMRVESGKSPKIKAGYGFEVKVVTLYETNRNTSTAFTEYFADPYSGGKYGSGYADYTIRTPNVTPMDSPNTIYINLDNGLGSEVCYILSNTKASGTWYQNRKVFELPIKDTLGIKGERKIYTATTGKTGVYGITISTPRPNAKNQFKGYEAEAPAVMTNKSYLHDTSSFTIEVLSQDDIKSHIIQ